jgi:hypothetical protein
MENYQVENEVKQLVMMFRLKGYSDEWIIGFVLSEMMWEFTDEQREKFIVRVGGLPNKNV